MVNRFNNLRRELLFCRVFTILCSLMYTVATFALSPNVNWYSVNEGLSQSMVTCFYKDRKGLMWIGTGDGLNSFDGRNFVKYRKNLPNSQGLQNSTIRQITEDEQGRLWVATDHEVYIFDPAKGVFSEQLNTGTGLGGWRILDFKRGVATIFSAGSGVFHYHPERRFLDTFGMARDRMRHNYHVVPLSDKVMILAGSEGISKATFEGNRLTGVDMLVSGDFHAIERFGGSIVSACRDKLVMIDSHLNVSVIPIRLQDDVYSVIQYRGQLLAGTAKALFRINPVTGQTDKLNIGNREQLVKVLWSDMHNLWIGTDGAGFGIWSSQRNKFVYFDLKEGSEDKPNSVFGIVATKKYIWHFVQNRGVVLTDYEGRIITELKGPENCFAGRFLCMRKSGNTVYIGSACGLYEVDENGLSPRKLTRFRDTVLDVVRSGGRLYTFGYGIKEYNVHGTELVYRNSYNHNSVSATMIKCAVSHNQMIWGTDGLLVFSFNENDRRLTEFRFGNNFPRIISVVVTPKNELALATYNGVYVYDMNELHKNTPRHVLKGEMIYGMVASGNRLWCSSNSGIYVLDGNYRVDRHFMLADGLQSLEFNSKGYDKTNEGLIFFGGINGTNMVHEDELKENTAVPRLMINSVSVNEQEVVASSYASTLKLRYDDNVFSARITALEYAIPERVRYQYKLEGWDKTWSNPSAGGYVRYTGTRPGNYSLYARACNGDGIWGQPVLLFHVHVVPPWWATWWFRITGLTIFILIGGLAVRYIARRKLKQQLAVLEKGQMLEAERSRISRDMHDDLGVELTKINLLSKHVLMKEKDRTENIRKIADTSDTLIQNMREIIWALNTNNDTLAITAAYLHEYALNLLEEHPVQLQFETQMQNEDMILGATTRRNLFLIYKEALNNILKHSGATQVMVKIVGDQHSVTLSIEDNGRGFNTHERRQDANGLLNMQTRAREINARMEIKSVPGAGTSLRLHLATPGTS